jgi:hypothetical protein
MRGLTPYSRIAAACCSLVHASIWSSHLTDSVDLVELLVTDTWVRHGESSLGYIDARDDRCEIKGTKEEQHRHGYNVNREKVSTSHTSSSSSLQVKYEKHSPTDLNA